MTYGTIDTFSRLFKVGGDDAPTVSDYSKHLSGEKLLNVSTEKARFAIGKIVSGKVVPGSPLVNFGGFCALFFKEMTTDGAERLSRIARFFDIDLLPIESLNLPFFQGDLSFAPLSENGEPFRWLEMALDYCDKKAVTMEALDEWEKSLPYGDAPLCVQSWFLAHGELPPFAEPYIDAKGLYLADKEVSDKWKKSTYPLICPRACRFKEECAERKYGLNSPEYSDVALEGLVQYADEPVFYIWKVDGKEVRFDREIDIIRQERFQQVCMRQIGRLPARMTNSRWLASVNKALAGMKTIGGKDAPRMTVDLLRDILTERMRDRTLVGTWFEYERLRQGWIYLDPSSASLVVEPEPLCSYIVGKFKDLRIDGVSEFMSAIKHLGFKGMNRNLDGLRARLWKVRGEYLFKTRTEWERYLLEMSKGTPWESNFKAFILGDADSPPPLEESLKDEIKADAALYLDTEERNGEGRD